MKPESSRKRALPTGVSDSAGRFRARMGNETIGIFDSVSEAEAAYKAAKKQKK